MQYSMKKYVPITLDEYLYVIESDHEFVLLRACVCVLMWVRVYADMSSSAGNIS